MERLERGGGPPRLMMFSARQRHLGGRNTLALALEARRAAGLPVIDLTLSNPTRAGFTYPPDLLRPLASERALRYEPEPFGLWSARQAVSDDFARRGVTQPAERIVLTASTSEAYALLFKLLCDPGDAVIAPRPSYPLLEHLTELEGVSLERYSLEFHGRWAVDVDGLREKLSAPRERRIRAIVLVSPNNPTGSVTTAAELEAVSVLARTHEVALISDDVFVDYPIASACAPHPARSDVLAFTLGGLSKSVGLPQVKLGWIGIGGPDAEVAGAMERLEIICDAYLSVSTPAQIAAPDLLAAGAHVRGQIQRRVRDNCAILCDVASAYPSCRALPTEAGWYAVVQVPAIKSEESLIVELLQRTGVLVHPGHFYDFEREAYLVLSLLPETDHFSSGLQRLFGEIGRRG